MKNKRAVVEDKRKMRLEEVEFPEVKGNPVIKVSYAGICGSDVDFFREGGPWTGVVPGHEYTGVIVDPGESDFKVGDRVLGHTQNVANEPCGQCEACLSGNRDKCDNRVVKICIGAEIERPGAYSEYVTWFPSAMFKIPDGVPSDVAALVEPMAVSLHANIKGGTKAGDKVLVMGGGIIGMACAEWARSFGATEIVMTDVSDEKREVIKGMNVVDHILDAKAKDLPEQFEKLVPGGFDKVYDCVVLENTIDLGITSLKRWGTFIFVGLGNKGKIPINMWEFYIRQLNMVYSKGHTPDEFMTVLSSMQYGKLNAEKYITKKVKLDDIQKTMEEITDGAYPYFKVLIEGEK